MFGRYLLFRILFDEQKMNDGDINDFLPSILNPRAIKKPHGLSLTQNSIVSRCSLSLKRQNNALRPLQSKEPPKKNIENSLNFCNVPKEKKITKKLDLSNLEVETASLGFSAIADLIEDSNKLESSFEEFSKELTVVKSNNVIPNLPLSPDVVQDIHSLSTIPNNVENTLISLSFGVNNCDSVQVTSNKSAIKKFIVTHKDNNLNIDCDIECSDVSTASESEVDENMNNCSSSKKRSAIDVNIEIKKQKLSNDTTTENGKVLILNTNAIEKLSHVIIQPPNYKFLKRNNLKRNLIKTNKVYARNVSVNGDNLKQISIDSYFRTDVSIDLEEAGHVNGSVYNGDEAVMSKNSSGFVGVKYDQVGRNGRIVIRDNGSPKSAKTPKRNVSSPKRQDVKLCSSESPSPRPKTDHSSAHSVRKTIDSIQFSLANKSKPNRSQLSPKNIPNHKIVAGTHFAVDAFSYGDIPNVKHYFLTHFHSDHYSGLKKTFNKILFCSKITAELCTSRLGVNPKYIHVINVDDTLRVDDVEVTAVDANHCPGAVMLIFTLPNGKTLLHTGDFRACPAMESYPIFWNKDIHTVYLDTTYCNPRYDFPTQDQSLEMALYILRQKKMALEKVGKRFSSVLIVCGTYSIGKEKFFLGMSRRVGCSVWACPEKERVLQALEGRATAREPPRACQLHVVPMRDLTHENLRNYLDSMQGAFSEVVAFKPSGWENGKNSNIEKDNVTIHGIPYSEHSSFSELVRFVKFLKPKQVVPTVDITGGAKAVQKYFPCPLVFSDDIHSQSKLTEYFSIQNRQQIAAVT